MSSRAHTALLVAAAVAVALSFAACESAGSTPAGGTTTGDTTAGDTTGDTIATDTPPADTPLADTATEDAGSADTAAEDAGPADTAAGLFACGATTKCQADQACASRGQGVCGGPAPDANGHCAPDCLAMDCGGSMHCLCSSYWCEDLPAGCTSCDCATPPDASCMCDDSQGHVTFECAGA